MKFARFIHCKCGLFDRKDLELMKKSQGGDTNWQNNLAGVHGNNNKNQSNHSEEDRGEETEGSI